jgi:hypothetical protein
MPKTETEAVEPKLIRLFAGDFERLASLYPHVSTAKVIRNLVRAHILKVEDRARVVRAKPTEVDLGGLIDE